PGSSRASSASRTFSLAAGARLGHGAEEQRRRNHECHYTNGTQQARYVERVIWGRQEICYYDSHVGYYVARTKEGRPIAEYRNRLEYLSFLWASVEKFCSYSYRRFKSLAMDRKVKPKIKIYPMKTESSHTPDLLVCSVTKFYPADIGVKWLKNGQEHTGKVVARELLPNGDWTFQMHVKLEMVPRRGDVYACQVDHISLQTPMILQWEVQTYSAKSKMIVGIVSLILGLIIIVTGLPTSKAGKTHLWWGWGRMVLKPLRFY
uniref:DLA class II histocompatibility antigen, DR-1 beta chain-like n=1 Tax=Crocodylus porosus TaxID=8502 RepID=A0A7M4FIZ7_CROPO